MTTIWKIHLCVLGAVITLSSLAALLLWLHPTLGFASRDSIISGADLRGTLTTILGLTVGLTAVVATLAIAVVSRFTRHRGAVLGIGYGIALLVAPAALRVFDHFF